MIRGKPQNKSNQIKKQRRVKEIKKAHFLVTDVNFLFCPSEKLKSMMNTAIRITAFHRSLSFVVMSFRAPIQQITL